MMSRVFIVFFVVTAFAACGEEDTSETPSRGTRSSGDAGLDAASSTGDASANDGGADAGATAEYEGEATYYDANGTGACGFPASNDFMVAAINDEQYSKTNCGRCVEVTGPNGKVVVRIVDKCPGCGTGDLDLSQTAFGKIAKLSAGRIAIKWHFVTCP